MYQINRELVQSTTINVTQKAFPSVLTVQGENKLRNKKNNNESRETTLNKEKYEE